MEYDYGGLDFVKFVELKSNEMTSLETSSILQECLDNPQSTSTAPHYKQDSFDMEALLQSIEDEQNQQQNQQAVDTTSIEGLKQYMATEEAAYKSFLKNHIASFFGDFMQQCKAILESKKVKRTISISQVYGEKQLPPEKDELKKSRKNLSLENKVVLMKWLEEHKSDPYPTDEEKQHLKSVTGLSSKQLNSWFVNARSRYLPKIKETPVQEQQSSSSSNTPDVNREIERQVLQYTPQQRGKREFKMQLKVKLGKNPFEKSL